MHQRQYAEFFFYISNSDLLSLKC